jgi:hypothetical protein
LGLKLGAAVNPALTGPVSVHGPAPPPQHNATQGPQDIGETCAQSCDGRAAGNARQAPADAKNGRANDCLAVPVGRLVEELAAQQLVLPAQGKKGVDQSHGAG